MNRSIISRVIDPFSISAQMNNLGVLIVAYSAYDIHRSRSVPCEDSRNYAYMNFILYGSTIVCVVTFLLSVLYVLGVIDYCINKVLPCSEVCLAINTLGIYVIGVLYHFIATVYGLYQITMGIESQCVELEMFKRITCTVYGVWFIGIIAYFLFSFYKNRSATAQLNTRLVEL